MKLKWYNDYIIFSLLKQSNVLSFQFDIKITKWLQLHFWLMQFSIDENLIHNAQRKTSNDKRKIANNTEWERKSVSNELNSHNSYPNM